MRQHQCSEDQFLKDASRHVMTVLRDDGVHRHIRFKRHGDSAYWFDLITWPGTLCVDGDMGTYVFRRLEDMFEFFRADREWAERKGCQLGINPSYWSEKLQASPGNGFEEFDADRFGEVVKEHFDRWVEAEDPDDETKQDVWQEIEDDVLSCAHDGEIRAFDAAINFRSGGFEFIDFWEHRLKTYTFHFIWCCYAIAWGIKIYDDGKLANKEAV